MADENIMQMALLAKALGGTGSKNNMTTLFGLDPNIIAQQQAQQQLQGTRNEAMQFANLDPFQRANYMLYQGGAGLGGGLMGAIGPESATVAKAKKVAEFRQLLSSSDINMNTADGQLKAADLARSMGLADLGIELTNNAVSMAKTQAETTKALQPDSVVERNIAFLTGINTALSEGKQVSPAALQQAALITQSMTTPRMQMGPDGNVVTFTPPSPLVNLPALAKAFGATAAAIQQQPQMPAAGQPTMPQGQVQQIAPGVTATQVIPPKVDAAVRKEIADTDSLITKFDTTFEQMSKLSKDIPNLNVSLARNIGRGVESQLGLTSTDQAIIDKMQRFINSARNDILLQAKGTQTEGDANRALDPFINDPTIWRNPQRLSEAWNTLTTYMTNNGDALRQKRLTLVPEGANVPAAPVKKTQQATQPKVSRADAFDMMKAANPNAREADINNWLDKAGY